MNKSHAIQNILRADYCPQLLHANSMFYSADEALSSIRLTAKANVENYLELFF
jgi:hypothetical protein